LFPEVIDGATTVVFKEFCSADVKTCAALIEVAEIVEVSKLVRSTKVVYEVSDWLTWPKVSIGRTVRAISGAETTFVLILVVPWDG